MLVFPLDWTETPPYTLRPVGPQVGYVPRVRRRVPVYQALASVDPEMAPPPVLVLAPEGTSWSAPGAALLGKDGQVVAYATSTSRRDPCVTAVLERSLDLSAGQALATWDASCWAAQLLAFRTPGASREAAWMRLSRQPVFCLRSRLEEQDIDVFTLAQACSHFGLPAPGEDVLSTAFTVRALLQMAWGGHTAHRVG
ncbi:hypothetical protein DAETH_47340 (plasmid) [Deinococcus aetherius]|uniref:Uncharacterized protein n=1 Tax=Deinococcus aetherius TaxID=200252 RepID=A0ABM8ALP6_9DEIO|nr:hypothetical protein [Deinococcus aetherius]BDP44765.1 hypothetical protein DAETH_47340 [Deinococcus aetherius]